MSTSKLLRTLRRDKQWTEAARLIYTTRRWVAFFNAHPELITVALCNKPDSRPLWDGFYRFFYGHFPIKTGTYVVYGKTHVRPWWYNDETFDPKWDRLFSVHQAGIAYRQIILPYLKLTSER